MRHGSRVGVATFSPDGRWVATGSDDNTARLWEVASGKKLHGWKLPGTYHQVAPTGDGRYQAALNKNSLVYVLRLGALSERD